MIAHIRWSPSLSENLKCCSRVKVPRVLVNCNRCQCRIPRKLINIIFIIGQNPYAFLQTHIHKYKYTHVLRLIQLSENSYIFRASTLTPERDFFCRWNLSLLSVDLALLLVRRHFCYMACTWPFTRGWYVRNFSVTWINGESTECISIYDPRNRKSVARTTTSNVTTPAMTSTRAKYIFSLWVGGTISTLQ